MPDPWAELAEKARTLAALAELYAPADPTTLTAALRELDDLAVELRGQVAACRVETWRKLRESGHSAAEIGQTWGVSRQFVTRKTARGGGAADG